MSRQRLLELTVSHLQDEGLGDRSLRSIAEAIGTSHRMLVYHFGSRDGLLAAVVDQVEQGERAAAEKAAAGQTDATRFLQQFWRSVASEDRAAEERLFFELVGQALQGRPGTESLLENLVEPWLQAGEAMAADLGASKADARVVARLDMAMIRGLLLDLLATGDRRGVNRAFRRYVEWRAPHVRFDRDPDDEDVSHAG